jgi:2-dehydropantoate 2-reductase
MKIALIGLGSIGSVLAFYLLKDPSIELLVVSQRLDTTIKLQNLQKIEETSREFLKITMDELLKITDIDVIIISGKVNDNKKIINNLNNLQSIPPILLAQNGINNEYDFDNIKYTIYRIVVTISAYIDENNTTILNFFKAPLYYGPVFEINTKPKNVMDILNAQGIQTENIVDKSLLLKKIWTKGSVNCCLNALSALYLMKMRNLTSHSYIDSIIKKTLSEIINVAREYGIQLEETEIINAIANSPENYSSMYTDITQNKNTEIDYLNGMIVKLGNEKLLVVETNTQIMDLIKELDNAALLDNTTLCNDEFELVKKLFDESLINNILKKYLNKTITKMLEIGFSKESFLSNDKHEMGNIGTENPTIKFDYLLGPLATIREKVNSILNTFFDSINKRPKVDSISLINYIFTNRTQWNKTRIDQLKIITNIKTDNSLYKYIYKNSFFDLWAPIIYIYPEFVFKRQLVKNITKPKQCNYNEKELLEPLSTEEKSFYNNNIEFHTGKCYYKPYINLLQTNFCSVAGISGHTLLLLELSKTIDFDWKPMLLCAILTNVPMHHSVDEVVRCVKLMKLENNNIPDNIEFLRQTIEELKIEEKKGGYKKCKARTNKKTKHQIKKTAKKVKNSKYKYSK